MRPGQTLAAAQALAPALAFSERDAAREAAALDTLSLAMLQFTSHVAPLPPQGLVLETGGSAALFGGLSALVQSIASEVAAQGFSATLASAPTPTGAMLLAASGFAETCSTPEQLRRALPGLPAASLGSAAGFAATFAGLGIQRIADLLALPRDGLARRFGTHLVDELDRAFGHRPDPVAPLVPPETFRSAIALPAPAESAGALLFACQRALRQLEGFLRAGQKALEHIDLTLHYERTTRSDAAQTTHTLTLSFFEPTASAARFGLILREHLDRLTLAARVERIVVCAPTLLEATPASASLLPAAARPGGGLMALLERLQARLGASAIHGLAVGPDHRPAHATAEPMRERPVATRGKPAQAVPPRSTSPQAASVQAAPAPMHAAVPQSTPLATGTPGKRFAEPLLPCAPTFGPRPVWLVEPARPLAEVGGKPHHDGPLTLVAGPERIESGWWDGAPVMRDYFIAQNPAHALVWIFRERREPLGWFLQGVFA